MAIISISINEKLTKELDELSKELGFSGRSEIYRAAIRDYMNNNHTKILKPEQEYTASLTIIVPENQRKALHEAYHDSGLVRSQFHMCISNNRCMEVLGLSGKGKQILATMKKIEAIPKIEKINLCIEN